jgi:putative glutamine amidotransferase
LTVDSRLEAKKQMNKPLIGITTDIEEGCLKLKHDYCEAIVISGGIPVLIPPTADPELYAERINGLLIPGGADLAPSYYHEEMMPQVKPVAGQRSDFEISLLNEILKFRKPVLGICYGMQLLNVFFGGTLYQDIASQLAVEINHKKDYHIIVVTENRFLEEGKFSVNSTHHQAVKEPGDNLSPFAYSTDNLIEAFYLKDYDFLVGVQWHPERLLGQALSLSLFKSFVKASDLR